MMEPSPESILRALEEAQKEYEFSILKISEPISSTAGNSSTARTSDVSADDLDNPTPASLDADLAHYKELFSKLRFSYVEQVTKEKFIRAIVGEPPLIVDHQENVELEERLTGVKASLKEQKAQAAEMVAELERRGRELSRKYEAAQLQKTQLEELPKTILQLQGSIAELEAAREPGTDPNFNLPLDRTLKLVEEKEREQAELDRQLGLLQATLPRKTRELERLEAELQPLEVRRLGATGSARESQRRKEEALGGFGDDLEERARWWRGVESGLKAMLDIRNL